VSEPLLTPVHPEPNKVVLSAIQHVIPTTLVSDQSAGLTVMEE